MVWFLLLFEVIKWTTKTIVIHICVPLNYAKLALLLLIFYAILLVISKPNAILYPIENTFEREKEKKGE